MIDSSEDIYIIKKGKRKIACFSFEELRFFLEHFFNEKYEIVNKLETENPGTIKRHLLELIDITYCKNRRVRDENYADIVIMTKKLFGKINELQDEDVAYISKEIFKGKVFLKTFNISKLLKELEDLREYKRTMNKVSPEDMPF